MSDGDFLDAQVAQMIGRFGLNPHPEGGWYKRTYVHPTRVEGRALGSAILYLVTSDFQNHWHRIDAEEIWHHYAGAPVSLWIGETKEGAKETRLGSNMAEHEIPQVHVPMHHWQRVLTDGPWSLLGCTVVPEFEFKGLEMDFTEDG